MIDPIKSQTRSKTIEILARLQGSFVEILRDRVPNPGGFEGIRPVDLKNALDIDSKLASQLHRCLLCEEVSAFASLLPPLRGLTRIASSLQDSVEADLDEQLSAILEDLSSCIEQDYGGRWAFDAAFSPYRPAALDEKQNLTDLQSRRDMYRATAESFGYSKDADMGVVVLAPSRAHEQRFDLARVRLQTGIRRYHEGVKIPLHAERDRTGPAIDRELVYIPPSRPLFEASDDSQVPGGIAAKWTSRRPLDLIYRRSRSGMSLIELGGNDIAEASACDIAIARFGESAVSAYSAQSEEGIRAHYRILSHVNSPVARYRLLVAIADDRSVPIAPRVQMVRQFPFEGEWSDARFSVVHTPVQKTALGARDRAPVSSTMSPLNEIAHDIIQELDWQRHRFSYTLFDVHYPVLHTAVSCQLVLPEGEAHSAVGEHQDGTTLSVLGDIQ